MLYKLNDYWCIQFNIIKFKNIDSLDYNTVYDLLYSYFSNMTTEIKKNEYQFNYNWSLEFSIKKIYK